MAGCNECKYYESKLGEYEYLTGSFPTLRKCVKGNDDKMNKWWEDNGKKHSSSILDDMDCHDHHDSVKILDSLNTQAQEILDLLRKLQ